MDAQPEKIRELSTLGARLRAARLAHNVTVTAAAHHVGISRVQFTQWEADRVPNPAPTKLAAFTQLVDINLDWLVSGTGPLPVFVKKRRPR